MKKGCLAIGVAALVVVGIAAALFVWLSPKPTFQVVNVDGQAVEVVPWLGGPSITVRCDGARPSIPAARRGNRGP